ncbi:MAG: SemiSWEET transporter [Methyloprofundus sp.]|nr:SemiSWEET transporter [Methyloprofundus sp.]
MEVITADMIGYAAAILTTLSFLPQAVMTIKTRDTESLSLGMYSAFTLGVFFWLMYGFIIKNKAIIYANSVTLVLAATILSVKIYNSFFKREVTED